ncbi:MAG: hypothetical protein RBT49_08455 [Bacteroidales bacterium]|jgi:hypothetical protein|nr:hypothetical protein [Bacteroidales bacterium]
MFYLVEVIFIDGKHSYCTFPVTIQALSSFANMLEDSKNVVVFKVIDSCPVEPKHFGFGGYKKWVTKFESEHFRY